MGGSASALASLYCVVWLVLWWCGLSGGRGCILKRETCCSLWPRLINRSGHENRNLSRIGRGRYASAPEAPVSFSQVRWVHVVHAGAHRYAIGRRGSPLGLWLTCAGNVVDGVSDQTGFRGFLAISRLLQVIPPKGPNSVQRNLKTHQKNDCFWAK